MGKHNRGGKGPLLVLLMVPVIFAVSAFLMFKLFYNNQGGSLVAARARLGLPSSDTLTDLKNAKSRLLQHEERIRQLTSELKQARAAKRGRPQEEAEAEKGTAAGDDYPDRTLLSATGPGCPGYTITSPSLRWIDGQFDRLIAYGGRPAYACSTRGIEANHLYFDKAKGMWKIGREQGSGQVWASVVSDAAIPEEISEGEEWQANGRRVEINIDCLPYRNKNGDEWATVSVGEFGPNAQIDTAQATGTYTATDLAGKYPMQATWTALSHKPRAFYIKNMLSKGECEDIMNIATSSLNRTQVVGQTGAGEVSNYRTNTGMFIHRPEHVSHPSVLSLREKYGQFVQIPAQNIEGINVLRYMPGQYYKPHTDWFNWNSFVLMARGGQRVATCLAWLNETPPGKDRGYTTFPRNRNIKKVPGSQGDVICFYNVDERGIEEWAAEHEAVPPKDTEKWVAVGWVRMNNFH